MSDTEDFSINMPKIVTPLQRAFEEIDTLKTRVSALEKSLVANIVPIRDPDNWMKEEPKGDGWVEWKGGECPVRSNRMEVAVKFRDGDQTPPLRDACVLKWTHDGSGTDIIAYKVVQ